MRSSRLPFLAALLIPSIGFASDSFVSSGIPYVSPTNARERENLVDLQEQKIRQYEPERQESDVNAQDMVRPPSDLQQHLLNQQGTYNPQQQHSTEQQRALAQGMADYHRVLRERNIDPNAMRAVIPPPQSSYPPGPDSVYYDPNKDYSPERHYMPTMPSPR